MTDGGLGTGQTLGTGQQQVLAGQDLGQLGTGEAGVAGNGAQGQRQHCGQHAQEHFLAEVVGTGLHDQGEQLHLVAQEILDQECVHIAGHGDQDHDAGGDQMVLPSVLLQSGVDAQHQAHGHGQQSGVGVDQNGVGQLGQEDLEAALAEVQLFGNTPVAADQALGQEVPELLSQGDGIAVDVTDTLTIAALKDELHILAELLGGLIGQQTDQDKAHGDNDQKCQKHEQDTFHNVFCHIHNKFPPLIFFTDRSPSGTGLSKRGYRRIERTGLVKHPAAVGLRDEIASETPICLSAAS